MNKSSIAILLLLCSLLFSGVAEARLTLGVVGDDDRTRSLANGLAKYLGEEVEVRNLADTETLLNWLERFAMVDMAVLPTPDVTAKPGRFLVLGRVGPKGEMSLVVAQGGGGDLPRRLSPLLAEAGATLWGAQAVAATPPAPPAPPAARVEPVPPPPPLPPVDRTAGQQDILHLPPLQPGKAWVPEGEVPSRDILSATRATVDKLVLGVVLEPGGPVRTTEQAERLAGYLQRNLQVPVTTRIFNRTDNMTEWFRRYRMIDLAIVRSETAADALGSDYLLLSGLYRDTGATKEPFSLAISRSNLEDDVFNPLQAVLVDMTAQPEGRTLLAEMGVGAVLPPGVRPEEGEALRPPAPAVAVSMPKPEPRVTVETAVAPEKPAPAVPEKPVDIHPPTAPPTVTGPAEPTAPGPLPVSRLPEMVSLPDVGTPPDVPPSPPQTKIVPPAPPQPTPAITVADLPPAPAAAPPALPDTAKIPEVIAAQPVIRPSIPRPDVKPPPATPLPQAPAEAVTPAIPDVPALPALPPAIEQAAPTKIEPVAPPAVTLPSPAEAPSVGPAPPVVAVDQRPGPEDKEELQKIVEELLPPEEKAVVQVAEPPPAAASLPEPTVEKPYDVAALLGDKTVASIVAQPELPEGLRPSGIPVLRPGRIPRKLPAETDDRLTVAMPQPLQKTLPPRPPSLLPAVEPEPGVVYVVPFVSVMVPNEVDGRIFDQFVDILNAQGESLKLQFVILKEGLQRVDPAWLAVRKYVTGEVYAYVEDSGSSSTDLRTKARLTYRKPSQKEPAFGFEYPVRRFFNHDLSTIVKERIALADNIAQTLADALIKALKN